MTIENNVKLVFRPTMQQYIRLNKYLSESGKYKTMSELLRNITEIGLKELEK